MRERITGRKRLTNYYCSSLKSLRNLKPKAKQRKKNSILRLLLLPQVPYYSFLLFFLFRFFNNDFLEIKKLQTEIEANNEERNQILNKFGQQQGSFFFLFSLFSSCNFLLLLLLNLLLLSFSFLLLLLLPLLFVLFLCHSNILSNRVTYSRGEHEKIDQQPHETFHPL